MSLFCLKKVIYIYGGKIGRGALYPSIIKYLNSVLNVVSCLSAGSNIFCWATPVQTCSTNWKSFHKSVQVHPGKLCIDDLISS